MTQALAKNNASSITHIALKHLSLDEGTTVLASMVKEFNEIANTMDPNDNSVNGAKWASVKKIKTEFQGEELRFNGRLLRMAANDRLDQCACCGDKVDGFFIGFERKHADHWKVDAIFPMHLLPTINGKLATCDHIIPQTLGGRDTVKNMQTMCNACNSSKGHVILDVDLAAVDGQALDVISVPHLYTAARSITKEYRAAKHAVKTNKGVKKFTARFKTAQVSVANLRKLIAFTHKNGISMLPSREAEVAHQVKNKQLIPA